MGKGQFAELTACLLARKGEAVPAAAGFTGGKFVSATITGGKKDGNVNEAELEDAGQTAKADAKPDAPRSQTAEKSKLVEMTPRQAQTQIERAMGKDANAILKELDCDKLPKLRKSGDSTKRAAVTLRLDTTQYLCLKMAGAKMRRTNQDILVEALDRYLATLADSELKDCGCLKKLIKEELS